MSINERSIVATHNLEQGIIFAAFEAYTYARNKFTGKLLRAGFDLFIISINDGAILCRNRYLTLDEAKENME